MNWKMPIESDYEYLFGEDYLAEDLFIFLLRKARLTPKVVSRNGKMTKLERGQCYATITYLAKRLRCNRKTIRKKLETLKNVYNVVDNSVDEHGVIITIKSFDEKIKMDNGMDNEYPTTTQRGDTNKNDKNVRVIESIVSTESIGSTKSKQEQKEKEEEEEEINKEEEEEKEKNIIIASEEKKSFGNPDINRGMEILTKGLGRRPPQEKLNRRYLYNLLRKHDAETIFSAMEYGLSLRGEAYAPVITSYIDLWNKIDALLAHKLRRQGSAGKVVIFDGKERTC